MLARLFFFIIINTFIYSHVIENHKDTTNINGEESLYFQEVGLFDQLLSESKVFYAEAIIADMSSDTVNTLYYFDNLFKALTQLEEVSKNVPEIAQLKYQKLLSSVIEYYDKKVVSVDHATTGYSTAVLKDKLEEYIYSQELEDIIGIEETIEIVNGFPITYNRKVQNVINYYTKQGRSHIQQWLNRQEKFKEIMLPILDDEDLPLELFYVAMVESGLRTDAKSWAAAVGPWQFIRDTGKAYGLKINYYYDERRDFEKSTRAAAKYLKDLYNEFGDWYLAFAAYNTGSPRIHRHMNYFKTNDFWELKNISKETQNYIPSILAIIFISKDPEKYGFTINSHDTFKWNNIEIDKNVKLDDISRCSGIPKKVLLAYNPEILKDFIKIEKNEKYIFRMPLNCNENFDSLFALVEEEQDLDQVVFKKHKIKRGESLWSIAIKYGSTITAICEVNNINRNKSIRAGKTITVPIGKYKKTPSKIYYKVKRGDTLGGIALKYKTTVKKIKKWNKNIKNDKIYIGQKIIIYR